MSVLFLSLRPEAGPALADWGDVDARLRPVFRRMGRAFGVQEVWAHERFFLRIMLTEMPSPHVALTVFSQSGPPPLEDDAHPVWPLVARLVTMNGWGAYVRRHGAADRDAPLAVAPGAFEAPLPEDHHERVAGAGPSVDLSDLDAVPWARLRHAFGPATDAPRLLRAVASDDAHARREAFRSLYGNLYHQGTTYDATVAAVPFFVRILREGPADGAPELLRYLSAIGESSEGVARAMAEAEASFVALGARGDEAGLWARRVTACLARVSPSAADWLERQALAAPTPTERDDLCHFIGALPPSPRWARLLEAALDAAPPERRLAPALALARHGAATLAALDALFAALVDEAPFAAWTADEAAWTVFEASPADLAFDELTGLSEAALAGAVAAASGPRAASERWPALAEVVAQIVKSKRSAAEEPTEDRRVLLEIMK